MTNPFRIPMTARTPTYATARAVGTTLTAATTPEIVRSFGFDAAGRIYGPILHHSGTVDICDYDHPGLLSDVHRSAYVLIEAAAEVAARTRKTPLPTNRLLHDIYYKDRQAGYFRLPGDPDVYATVERGRDISSLLLVYPDRWAVFLTRYERKTGIQLMWSTATAHGMVETEVRPAMDEIVREWSLCIHGFSAIDAYRTSAETSERRTQLTALAGLAGPMLGVPNVSHLTLEPQLGQQDTQDLRIIAHAPRGISQAPSPQPTPDGSAIFFRSALIGWLIPLYESMGYRPIVTWRADSLNIHTSNGIHLASLHGPEHYPTYDVPAHLKLFFSARIPLPANSPPPSLPSPFREAIATASAFARGTPS